MPISAYICSGNGTLSIARCAESKRSVPNPRSLPANDRVTLTSCICFSGELDVMPLPLHMKTRIPVITIYSENHRNTARQNCANSSPANSHTTSSSAASPRVTGATAIAANSPPIPIVSGGIRTLGCIRTVTTRRSCGVRCLLTTRGAPCGIICYSPGGLGPTVVGVVASGQRGSLRAYSLSAQRPVRSFLPAAWAPDKPGDARPLEQEGQAAVWIGRRPSGTWCARPPRPYGTRRRSGLGQEVPQTSLDRFQERIQSQPCACSE